MYYFAIRKRRKNGPTGKPDRTTGLLEVKPNGYIERATAKYVGLIGDRIDRVKSILEKTHQFGVVEAPDISNLKTKEV